MVPKKKKKYVVKRKILEVLMVRIFLGSFISELGRYKQGEAVKR